MVEQQKLIEELLERVAALEAEILRLKAENAKLRRRLEMNSQNSHKPPSSDGYRKKSVRPAMPRQEKQAPDGKAGDKVYVHLPEACSVRGRTTSAEEKHAIVGSL